jgi:hypothetical protein
MEDHGVVLAARLPCARQAVSSKQKAVGTRQDGRRLRISDFTTENTESTEKVEGRDRETQHSVPSTQNCNGRRTTKGRKQEADCRQRPAGGREQWAVFGHRSVFSKQGIRE